jgi:transposase InsO family protein
MPWKEERTMDLRVRLIQEYNEGESITALAEHYGVSRRTIHKWLDRHETDGAAGLADRSRAPHHSPTQLSQEVVQAIIAARQRWKWGPRKLRIKLAQAQPEIVWPAASSIGEVLKKKGLIVPRKRRLRTPPYAPPFADIAAPNQTWCADFKGWFRTGDGQRCDPLTITDAFSRYLICCQIVPKTNTVHVEALFHAAFREYGLPLVIHTDNGAPFASRAPGGLSRLSMNWVKLGILPERSRPACPQDNPTHERMHGTLKQSTLQPPAATPAKQQVVFDHFLHEFGHERPHDGLGGATPASVYAPSPRPLPRRIPDLVYGDDVERRRVYDGGQIQRRGVRTFISEIFAGEDLGLKACDERYYEVLFGPVLLGYLDTHTHTFHRRLTATIARHLGLDIMTEN